jgi:hypothetical protein
MKALILWFASLFDESSTNSFSRFITFVIVAFILGWDTSFVHQAHALPDVATMAGQGVFMAVFYGIRRTAGAVTDVNAPKP